MSDSPLVSIILPFYQSPHLAKAIESIVSQTFAAFELILVDNNSPGDARDVANRYLVDPRVRLIDEPCQGVVHAMNTGIAAAKGRYIMRMDSDDYAYPDRIQNQLDAFSSDIELGVVSGEVEYDGPETNEGFQIYVDWVNGILSNKDIQLNQFVEFPLVNPSLMFRRELFDQYGYFKEGDFPEDYEFFLRLQSHGVKMGKVDHKVLKWKDTNSRLTRTDERYSQEAFFKVKTTYLARWLITHNPHHPNVFIWGAGKLSKRRSTLLSRHQLEIQGYIDVKKKEGVIHYQNLPDKNSCFIISYVGNRGAREEIRSYLLAQGYEEGLQFILAS